jgi:hypothetical protein
VVADGYGVRGVRSPLLVTRLFTVMHHCHVSLSRNYFRVSGDDLGTAMAVAAPPRVLWVVVLGRHSLLCLPHTPRVDPEG